MKKLVQDYYNFVDSGRLDKLSCVFSENIIYNRGGKIIKGIDALTNFYLTQRQIQGNHIITELIETPGMVISIGYFNGLNRNGESTKIEFVDVFKSNSSILIDFRHTYLSTGYETTL